MADNGEKTDLESVAEVSPNEAMDQEDIELELPPAGLLPEGVLADVEINPEGLTIKFLNVPGTSSMAVAMYALLGMQNLREVFHDDLEGTSLALPGIVSPAGTETTEELVVGDEDVEEGDEPSEDEEEETEVEEITEPVCTADSALICKADENRYVVRLKRPKKQEAVTERRRMGFNTDTP